jgi:hypothetical protein
VALTVEEKSSDAMPLEDCGVMVRLVVVVAAWTGTITVAALLA